MQSLKNIWRYSWNPAGYEQKEVSISTANDITGTIKKFNHTFFIGDTLLGYYIDNNVKIFLHIDAIKDTNTDILLEKKDEELSRLANKDIYSSFSLVSSRVLQKELFFAVTFVGDAIDFNDFQQTLNPQSKVQFKKVTTSEVDSDYGAFKDTYTNTLHGEWGSLSKDEVVLTTFIDSKGLTSSEDGLNLKNTKEVFGVGSKDFCMKFDTKQRIAQLSLGVNNEYVILKGPKTIEEIPIFGIPVILNDDKTRLSFVPWVTLDVPNKGIKVGSITIGEDSYIRNGEMVLFKNKTKALFTITDYPFIEIDRNTGDVSIFKGLISMNLNTRIVSINGTIFDPSFFANILQMQRDIQFLKNKIH